MKMPPIYKTTLISSLSIVLVLFSIVNNKNKKALHPVRGNAGRPNKKEEKMLKLVHISYLLLVFIFFSLCTRIFEMNE